MKTFNLNLELLTPMQINRDVIINEALFKLDSLNNFAVSGFINAIPQNCELGKKYILSEGDKKDCIIYCYDLSKGWQIIEPRKERIVFVIADNNFYKFNENWEKISFTSSGAQTTAARPQQQLANVPAVPFVANFTTISGSFQMPSNKQINYLYLNEDCEVEFRGLEFPSLTLVVKQNYARAFKINWQGNIMWPQKIKVQISQTPNLFDIFRFYKLPETNHVIAEVVGQGYSF